MLHLRNINPYVESTFGDWSKSHCLVAHVARTAAPLTLTASTPSAEPPLTGTSSFGMSGVNAHALFEAALAVPRQHCVLGMATLQRAKHWAVPDVRFLVEGALAGPRSAGARCSILADLRKPALASLWDHKVAGRVLLPASAMFEAAAAAGSTMYNSNSSSGVMALHSVSIAEALVMPLDKEQLVVEVAVDSRTGHFQLLTRAGSSRSNVNMHCNGVFISISVQQAAAAPRPPSSLLYTLRFLPSEQATASAPAAAFSAIWLPHSTQRRGFAVDPAVADNVLHLSGAFTPAHKRPALRIPVGISALALRQSSSYACWSFPLAVPQGSSGEGMQLGFKLQVEGQQATPVYDLSGLLVKEVGDAQARAAITEEFLYSTEWQAYGAEAATVNATSRAALAAAAGWEVTVGSTAVFAALPTVASAGTMLALQLMQGYLPSAGSQGSLAVSTSSTAGTLPSLSSSAHDAKAAATAASLHALVKVGSLEHPAVKLSSLSTISAGSSSKAGAADQFGAATAGGALLRAKLLRLPAPVVSSDGHLMPLPRGSLEGLRLVPHDQGRPGPGEIKASWCGSWVIHLLHCMIAA